MFMWFPGIRPILPMVPGGDGGGEYRLPLTAVVASAFLAVVVVVVVVVVVEMAATEREREAMKREKKLQKRFPICETTWIG
jgi:hypothetical protein